MPLFLCRWPNGEFSIALARSKEAAIKLSEEVGNIGPCRVLPIRDFLAHFGTSDSGQVEFRGLGEATVSAISEKLKRKIRAQVLSGFIEKLLREVIEERGRAKAAGPGESDQSG